jgi:hypothetical protein
MTYAGGARNDGPWTNFDKSPFQVDAFVAAGQPMGSVMVFWDRISALSDVEIAIEVKIRFFKRRVFDAVQPPFNSLNPFGSDALTEPKAVKIAPPVELLLSGDVELNPGPESDTSDDDVA